MYFDRRLLVRIGTQVFETAISMKGFLPGTRTDVATIATRGLAARAHPVQIDLAAAGSQDPDTTLNSSACLPTRRSRPRSGPRIAGAGWRSQLRRRKRQLGASEPIRRSGF